MHAGIATSLFLLFFKHVLIIEVVQATVQCYYTNGTYTPTTTCRDDCCSAVASSADSACCSSISWSSLAIPFFIVVGVCFLAIFCIYCRPVWKLCLCGIRCPCSHRTQVESSNTTGANDYPVHIINNEGLPDYETIVKDTTVKDLTPPPYNFVTSHPNDFGIEQAAPNAPPQYTSRPNSAAVNVPNILPVS